MIPKLALVLSALPGFVGCYTHTRVYEGPGLRASQVAKVIGRADQPFATAAPGMPERVAIVQVDGTRVDAESVELLPGGRTLVVSGRRFDVRRARIESTRVELKFSAKAGETYLLKPKRSEHQPPWSFNLVLRGTQEVVATSEPVYEDLDLARLPEGAKAWKLHSWSKTLNADFDQHAGPIIDENDDRGDPAEFLWRKRWTPPQGFSTADLRYRLARERRAQGFNTVQTIVSEDVWTERWVSTGPNEANRISQGAGRFSVTDGSVYMTAYVTQSTDADTESAAKRCDEWHAEFGRTTR